ncbi:MAG: hypothetical protein IKP24_00220 [Alphaproteobacteria bacterium]|nr:hypothetical protein [Alphaproteobacteria bacterium]
MKNYAKVLVFAALVALIVVPAQALDVSPSMCELIGKMQDVFKLLRILAFVGAGFYMASWAWGYIVGGKDGAFSIEDVKKKGIGLLVGFTLLFAIGIVISFLLGAQDAGGKNCLTEGWGK